VDEKRIRLDFVIALCALLISTVAAVATVYQTRVIANQFSATVWPYLSVDVTNSPTLFQLDLRNDGLGPAIVRSVTLTWNGKREPSLETLLRSFYVSEPHAIAGVRAALRAGAKLRLTTSTPTAGLVIPANSGQTVIRMEGAPFVMPFHAALDRFGLSLCYCSLTGSCWTQNFRSRQSEPVAVPSCSRSA
jgi:hypothetical protein